MTQTKVIIDATSRVLYASFYIQGLYDVFGNKNVRFGRHHFKDLYRHESLFSFEHYFAFVIIKDNFVTRYVIDFCDPPDISQEAYQWCDVYAKINFRKGYFDDTDHKIIIIPPSFGIKVWSLPKTLFMALKNRILSFNQCPANAKVFLKDYWQQYKRLPLKDYRFKPNQMIANFVYMIGTLWKPDPYTKITNANRKSFIKYCRENEHIRFEGGLYTKNIAEHPDDFANFVIDNPYSIVDYVEKTKQSMFVFNTPAVHQCHGWKLAEFLALGKAIISTPLLNELVSQLTHQVDIHFVNSEEELKEAIHCLVSDKEYVEKLSQNAFAYFEKHMTPAKVIESILK